MTHYMDRIRFRAYQPDEASTFDDRPPPPPPPGALFYDPFGAGATIVPPWFDDTSAIEGVNVTHRIEGDLQTLTNYILEGEYTILVPEVLYRLSFDFTMPQTTLDYFYATYTGTSWPGDPLVLLDNLVNQDGSIGWDLFDNGSNQLYLSDWWNGDTLVNPIVGDHKYSLSVEFTFHAGPTADAEFFVDGVSTLVETPATYNFTGSLTNYPAALNSFVNITDVNLVTRLDNVLLETV